MFAPKQHVTSLNDFSAQHFSELLDLVRRTGFGNGLAFIHVGRPTGQSIEHVHVHFIVPPNPSRLEVVAQGKIRDPLSGPIIAFAAKNNLIPSGVRMAYAPKPVVSMKIDSQSEAPACLEKLVSTSRGLETAFNRLKAGGEAELRVGATSTLARANKRELARLLRERTNNGFGLDIAIARRGDGFSIRLVPVVTAPSEKRSRHSGGPEQFLNLIVDRNSYLSPEFAAEMNGFLSKVGTNLRRQS